jgi:hypothetical protein
MNNNFNTNYLNTKEIELLRSLTKEYEHFIAPGFVTRNFKIVQSKVSKLIPMQVQNSADELTKKISESDLINQTLEVAGKGFFILQQQSAKLTISKNSILNDISNKNKYKISEFDKICTLRSYDIEKCIANNNYKDLFLALSEGVVTGFPGIIGLPFNIALSFFLFFRAVQNIAVYYGYDVKDDPRELEFASSVVMACFSPNAEKGTETLGGVIGEMMLSANFDALKSALGTKSLKQMAESGGLELLYVQIRALANKAAQKALNKAGKDSLEQNVFKQLLEQLGKMLPKEAAQKSIPFVSAVIGGMADTYYMSRILKGANLIYHKRFLFEKEKRISLLLDSDNDVIENY